MAYTFDQIRELLSRAGAASGITSLLAAIGLAESGGDPTVRRYCPGDGSCYITRNGRTQRVAAVPGQGREDSIGLFQINRIAHPQYSPAELADPVRNVQIALEILKSEGFRAWGSFTDGRYKRYVNGSGSGAMLTLPSGVINSASDVFRDWRSYLFEEPQPTASELFAPYTRGGYITAENRKLFAFGIAVILIVFVWREF